MSTASSPLHLRLASASLSPSSHSTSFGSLLLCASPPTYRTLLAPVKMRTSFALLAAAAAFSSSLVAADPSIQSPVLYQCTPASYQYTCDVTPCTIVLRPENDVATSIANLGQVTDASGAISWTPNVAVGTSVVAYITNNNGVALTNAPTTVNEGSSSCLSSTASSAAGGASSAASSAAATSSSAESSAARTSSAASSEASSRASSASSAASSAASSGTSRASSAASAASSAASSVASSASGTAASASATPDSGAASLKVGGLLAGVATLVAALA
ncbi:hypothetical protein JCM8097_000877 [Rhodosporidiobolus ruineniae]